MEMSEEDQRNAKLANLAHCREMGVRAYDGMHEAHSFRAIKLADEMGLTDDLESLSKRLEHIKMSSEASLPSKRI